MPVRPYIIPAYRDESSTCAGSPFLRDDRPRLVSTAKRRTNSLLAAPAPCDDTSHARASPFGRADSVLICATCRFNPLAATATCVLRPSSASRYCDKLSLACRPCAPLRHASSRRVISARPADLAPASLATRRDRSRALMFARRAHPGRDCFVATSASWPFSFRATCPAYTPSRHGDERIQLRSHSARHAFASPTQRARRVMATNQLRTIATISFDSH